MKKNNSQLVYWHLSAKMWFSFVELIIVIAIIALISVIWVSINSNYTEKSKNSKITSDIKTIKNSIESYKNETKTLPLPKWNQKYFDDSSNYVHYDNPTAFWVYGYITEDTVPKKYMNFTPIDPRTNQYYAYGKTLNGTLVFELAWVNKKDGNFESMVLGDYTWENWPYNLIREYNWPDFVYDKSKNNFPYNPEERVVKAKIWTFSWTVSVNGTNIDKNWAQNNDLKSWDTIIVNTWWLAELYYSDWSKSYLWTWTGSSKLTLANMAYKWENNLLTKIQLALDYGSIWTKTSKLEEWSDFEIYTTDTEAAVRWTIFNLSKLPNQWWLLETTLAVETWSVSINRYNIWPATDIIEVLKTNAPINRYNLHSWPLWNPNVVYSWSTGEVVAIFSTWQTVETKIWTSSITTPIVIPNSVLPDEDWLENITPKIKSINAWEVILEFPSSFSGTSNEKKVRKNWSVITNWYTFISNELKLLSWAEQTYTIDVCDKYQIKCTNKVSVNKELSYNQVTGTWCNLATQVEFTWTEYSWCIDVDQGLTLSWYSLVAYAPYDWDYKLYYNTWASFYNNSISPANTSSYFDIISWINKWIFITWTNETIKYSLTWLWLVGYDYAFEINIRSNTSTWPSTRYIFNIDNYRLYFSDTLQSLILKNDSASYPYNFSSKYDWNYHKIIAKKEWTNFYLNVDSGIYNTFPSTYPVNIGSSYFYIWSKNDLSSTFNNMIDYIKIYKK